MALCRSPDMNEMKPPSTTVGDKVYTTPFLDLEMYYCYSDHDSPYRRRRKSAPAPRPESKQHFVAAHEKSYTARISPRAPRGRPAAALECLPLEILHRMFEFSCNLNLLRALSILRKRLSEHPIYLTYQSLEPPLIAQSTLRLRFANYIEDLIIEKSQGLGQDPLLSFRKGLPPVRGL